jgi:hypothetical protein
MKNLTFCLRIIMIALFLWSSVEDFTEKRYRGAVFMLGLAVWFVVTARSDYPRKQKDEGSEHGTRRPDTAGR